MIQLTGLIPGKDIELKFTGLRPGEKLFEELLNKEEEVIPTHNKKILIAKVIEYDFDTIDSNINFLIDLALKNEDVEVVKQMKKLFRNTSVITLFTNLLMKKGLPVLYIQP